MLSLLVVLKSVPSTQERCPYCHDDLGYLREACDQCRTVHHPKCLAELGRCTVLGCSGSRRRRRLALRRRRLALQPERPAGLWRVPITATLVVAGLLGLLALADFAFAPRCRGSNDAAAIGALKAIANGQTLYREGDKDGNNTLEYAPNLESLTNTGSSGQEDLIDEVLASGTKQGYVFAITSSSEFGWTATANPVLPGTTGHRYFGANMSGLIFFNTERPVRFAADGSSTDPVLGQ